MATGNLRSRGAPSERSGARVCSDVALPLSVPERARASPKPSAD